MRPIVYALAVIVISLAGCATDKVQAQGASTAATQGDPDAQNRLGAAYAHGRGVPKDDGEAVKWYRLAAAQGYTPAQISLG